MVPSSAATSSTCVASVEVFVHLETPSSIFPGITLSAADFWRYKLSPGLGIPDHRDSVERISENRQLSAVAHSEIPRPKAYLTEMADRRYIDDSEGGVQVCF